MSFLDYRLQLETFTRLQASFTRTVFILVRPYYIIRIAIVIGELRVQCKVFGETEASGSEGYDRTISDFLGSDRWYNVHDNMSTCQF